MNEEDAELIESLRRPTLPANAGKSAGFGGLLLLGFVGFVAWRKYFRR